MTTQRAIFLLIFVLFCGWSAVDHYSRNTVDAPETSMPFGPTESDPGWQPLPKTPSRISGTAPVITFSPDADTGFYEANNDGDIHFAVDGVDRYVFRPTK